MDIHYEQLNKLPLWRRMRAARAISKVVCAEAANDKMKRKTPRQLLALEFSLLALDGTKVVGHVSTEAAVVGALFVDPDYRGKGIAVDLIAAATGDVVRQKLQPVAYCNESSVRAFEKCGYSEDAEQDKPNRTKMIFVVPAEYSHQGIGRILVGAAMA